MLLELRGIRKRFGGIVALRDGTLSVLPGEVHALVGENGAGKSTLARIVAGMIS
ncbi:MAG: ATP-binding cassette domain-containing protein, partial [Bryobacteraceae bacterium]